MTHPVFTPGGEVAFGSLATVAFLAAGLGWWILSTTEISSDHWFGKLFWRVPSVAWTVIGLALLVALAHDIRALIAMDGCGRADLPWYIYYGIGCWL